VNGKQQEAERIGGKQDGQGPKCTGACYLKDHLHSKPELNTVRYWADRPVEDDLTELSTTARLIALDNLQSAIFGHKRGFVASNQAMSRCRIRHLFRKACNERHKKGGKEFSDAYDTGLLRC